MFNLSGMVNWTKLKNVYYINNLKTVVLKLINLKSIIQVNKSNWIKTYLDKQNQGLHFFI